MQGQDSLVQISEQVRELTKTVETLGGVYSVDARLRAAGLAIDIEGLRSQGHFSDDARHILNILIEIIAAR